MIKTHSDDPDVAAAAGQARDIIATTLKSLPRATTYDYGGHMLQVGEYGVCSRCAEPIAEAQAASRALTEQAEAAEDPTVAEHLQVAAELLRLEAAAAEVRAELHNGQNSEPIVNELLAFIHDRSIHDTYDHSHHGGAE